MSDYYKNGKCGQLDGAPIWRPKWWGTLGNDKEFVEATKPRTAFKTAYYEGGHRMVFDGVPIRVAAHVKDWAPWMKRALGKGTSPNNTWHLKTTCKCATCEYARQMAILLGKHYEVS